MVESLDGLGVHDLIVLLLRAHEDKIVVNGMLDADYLASVIELIAAQGKDVHVDC